MILKLLISLGFIYVFVIRYLYCIYIFQLNHYELRKYIKWLCKNRTNKRIIIPSLLSLISIVLLLYDINNPLVYPQGVLMVLSLFFIHFRQEKKKLKFTSRMIRLILVFLAVLVVSTWGCIYLLPTKYSLENTFLAISIIGNFVIYDLFFLAHLFVLPIERYLYDYYVNKARQKILSYNSLKVIGITGSFGKTSTKFIIGEILKKDYSVCVTPASYNTPMGLCITINKQLRNIDEFLICEMGACRIGDIQELCHIVFPDIGIITSIGPQHLETFGNLTNIIKTKFELIESLPKGGLAILNYDNYYIRNYRIKNDVKVLTYGIEHENVDYYALNIKYDQFGSTFEVRFPEGERYLFKTKLLGKHNISNILAAIALGDYLKINVRKIIHTVSTLEPVKHRLELKRFPNYCLIDDSFNANYEGFNNALDILNQFKYKRIIITPGLIELGDEQYTMNYRIGEKIARCTDYVVLVGKKQTKPIYNALLDNQYPSTSIYVTNSFEDGFKHVLNKFKSDFTVLLENDLPDQYNES